jgi:hypothetical protein
LNPIIEDIGSAGGLFPYIYDWMDFEIPFLRCYSDSISQYNTDPNLPCDTLLNSMDDFAANNFVDIILYPVPVNDRLNFHFNSTEKIDCFLLYDEVGRIISTGDEEILRSGISISNFSSGFYFMRFIKANCSRSIRFVISHP